MAERHINYDPIYNTVDRDNFEALVHVERYADRSDAFDGIIAATEEHFWDPQDPRYVDFEGQPFDLSEQTIMPREFCIELHTAVAEKLDEAQKVRLANQNTRFILSSILHGEQGALSLSASLTSILRDPGAQEYAANQTREEARHVTGFSNYIGSRWGTPLASGQTLQSLLAEIVRRRPDLKVQASGGVAQTSDLTAARDAGCDGAIIGRALYEGRFTVERALEAVR